MNLIGKIQNLFRKVSDSKSDEPRSIVIMQRQMHRFSEEELLGAAQRGWNRKFDGKEDPMYFVSANHSVLDVVKAGPHVIRVTSISQRYADDNEYALSQLPQPEQKKAWSEHHACTHLTLFNDLSKASVRILDKDAYASL